MKKTSIYAVSLIFTAMLLTFPVAIINVHASTSRLGYVKPSFPDYVPSGMPDFDEKQNNWGPAAGWYTWCCPVAVANSLWWLDSEYESLMFPAPVPPPIISDHFSLVTSYNPAWDDHDPQNVDPLVRDLAFLMDTDGQRTHDGHTGTRTADVAPGIQTYLINHGVMGTFEVHSQSFPSFAWIDNETEKCQDVELFLEFWQLKGGVWTNSTITNPSLELGHCVTSAGSDPATSQLLISDPYFDVAMPFPPAVHNDANFVSHDAYTVAQYMGPPPSPYGPIPVYELIGYWLTMGLDPSYHAFIRGAVATSPLVSPVHDVATDNVTTAKTVIGRGYGGNITVTAENQGTFAENFNVTNYANSTVTTSLNFNLPSGGAGSQICVWNTSGFGYGNYSLKGAADVVPGETDVGDNNCSCGVPVHVGVPGDISGPTQGAYDGTCNMRDIQYLILYFNTNPSSPNWKPNADVNNDGTVNMRDIQIAILNFNQHE
jgi:Dockerin type I domain